MPFSAFLQRVLGGVLFDLAINSLTLERGTIVLTSPDGRRRTIHGLHSGPECELVIHAPLRFLKALSLGTAALGRSYADGVWDADNLVNLGRLNLFPKDRLSPVFSVIQKANRPIVGFRRFQRRNSRRGAKKNICAHYDLGNHFYSLWLDPSMTYSAGLFEGQRCDLETAQRKKYECVLTELATPKDGHILEIGCGWGGFAELAGRAGFKVTGITLSSEQHRYARKRIALAGLADRVKIELMDYRNIVGEYDGIVSLEMIEAVGEAYWPIFFSTITRALKPGARAILQAITISDEDFEDYREGSEFIREEIFPGGMLISPDRLRRAAANAGLNATTIRRFGADYARTLKAWCGQFDANVEQIKRLGFDERFIRLWRLYLLGCQGAFEAERIDVGHFRLEKTRQATR